MFRSVALGGLVAIVVGSAPVAAQMPHGRVEPCTVEFVQDNTMTCELCRIASCADDLRARGYQKKCQTGYHAEPGEVWCIAKPRPSASTAQVWVALSLAAAALGAFFLWRSRRRKSSAAPR